MHPPAPATNQSTGLRPHTSLSVHGIQKLEREATHPYRDTRRATASEGLVHRRRSSAQIHAVGTLALVFANPMLFAIQVVQHIVHVSLTDQTTRLDRSALRIYGSNKAARIETECS